MSDTEEIEAVPPQLEVYRIQKVFIVGSNGKVELDEITTFVLYPEPSIWLYQAVLNAFHYARN